MKHAMHDHLFTPFRNRLGAEAHAIAESWLSPQHPIDGLSSQAYDDQFTPFRANPVPSAAGHVPRASRPTLMVAAAATIALALFAGVRWRSR